MSENIDYEVIKKETGEIFPVAEMIMGNEIVIVKFETENSVGELQFQNKDRKGELTHKNYAIRQVGTKLSANADKIINDEGIEIDITEDQRQDIQAGLISPDEIIQ